MVIAPPTVLTNGVVYISAHGWLRPGRTSQQLAHHLSRHLEHGRSLFVLDLRECKLARGHRLASIIAEVRTHGGIVRLVAADKKLLERLRRVKAGIYADFGEAMIGFGPSLEPRQ